MIVDVHCHVGFSAKPIDEGNPRFSFEADAGPDDPLLLDSFMSPRLLSRPVWRVLGHLLGIDSHLPPGAELDQSIDRVNREHFDRAKSVDRLVLLAFDRYHDDDGRAIGPANRGQPTGSDLYVSNSLVRTMCRAQPDRYLFGGSIHPYRSHQGVNACQMLEELAASGVALIKWLPIHQNIRADDPRTVSFLRAAAALGVPMLIHYGGEMTLARQHMEFEDPGPMLAVLRQLRREDAMPTVIVAHAATPSFPLQSAAGHRRLVDALLGEFADAPLYADISALAAFGRTRWLKRLARHRELHSKLVWGTDFPIPVMLHAFRRALGPGRYRSLREVPSWIERDLLLKQAIGFDDCVFDQAARILRIE
ncbi:MAG: amidohydrolase family protein [Phycisphaerae bacterium]